MKTNQNDARKMFRKKGSCSHTFFFLLNREFDQLNETNERAADPLAGGIKQYGHQCGMLWGSALAVGAEAYRRYPEKAQAIAVAVRATRHIMNSFADRTGSVNCRTLTRSNFKSTLGLAKYIVTGRFRFCFRLSEQWIEEAIQAAHKGLEQCNMEMSENTMNCATMLAEKLEATDEEAVMVAGLAGGMGLNGEGCGALSVAIWLDAKAWSLKNPGKSTYSIRSTKPIVKVFREMTGGEMLCHKICGRHFSNLSDHAQYMDNKGCEDIINTLAEKTIQNKY